MSNFLKNPKKVSNINSEKIFRRKQIEEISNNIQEARRVFERLESDTRQLVLVSFCEDSF